MNKLLLVLGIAVVVVGVVGLNTLFTVHQTQQALVLQFGEPKRIVQEPGLNVKIPFIQNVVYLDKRILSLDAPPEEVITSDQKRIVVDGFSRFRITDALRFYQTVGNENIARSRLAGLVNSSLRNVLGEVELLTLVSGERFSLMRQITDSVNAGASSLGIEVVDVRIKRADLPPENSQAIYRRMQTEREREAKEARARGAEEALRIRSRADRDRTVLLAEAQKQSEILRGEGDGARARIFNDAAQQNPEFYAFYRSLQAYRQSLTGDGTSMVLSPDSDFFQFFGDISSFGGAQGTAAAQ
ncbi:MAG: protease modulator HflC [Minwuiales bacterium]|nr:protease modulator HflC [Minwuiales bacterium]